MGWGRVRGCMCIWIWEGDETGCVVWLLGSFLDMRRKKGATKARFGLVV